MLQFEDDGEEARGIEDDGEEAHDGDFLERAGRVKGGAAGASCADP